jgi:hypothetical protein
MTDEEREETMRLLKEKIADLSDKFKDTADTVQIIGLGALDIIKEKAEEAKSTINAMKENYNTYAQSAQNMVASKLLEAQMNIEAAKKQVEEKKEEIDKENFENYIKTKIEYADALVNLSKLTAEEAKLAYLEALKDQKEFEEKNNKKEE